MKVPAPWRASSRDFPHAAQLTICCFLLCGFAFSQEGSRVKPSREITDLGDLLSASFTAPRLTNGYFLSFRPTADAPKTDAIRLQNLTLNEETTVPFWPAGSSRYWINDADITSNRQLLVAGVYASARDDGMHNFVAELNPDGSLSRSLSLDTFEPMLVCAATDSSIWVLGQNMAAEAAGDSYSLLRNYSMDGRLLGTYLKREDLAVKRLRLNLSRRLHYAGSRVGKRALFCSSKSVGVYLGPALTWVSVDLKTKSEERWRIPSPGEHVLMSGIAVTQDEVVYASFRAFHKDGSESHTLCALSLGPAAVGTWKAVQGFSSELLTLVGSDGRSLVYFRRGAQSTLALAWSSALR